MSNPTQVSSQATDITLGSVVRLASQHAIQQPHLLTLPHYLNGYQENMLKALSISRLHLYTVISAIEQTDSGSWRLSGKSPDIANYNLVTDNGMMGPLYYHDDFTLKALVTNNWDELCQVYKRPEFPVSQSLTPDREMIYLHVLHHNAKQQGSYHPTYAQMMNLVEKMQLYKEVIEHVVDGEDPDPQELAYVKSIDKTTGSHVVAANWSRQHKQGVYRYLMSQGDRDHCQKFLDFWTNMLDTRPPTQTMNLPMPWTVFEAGLTSTPAVRKQQHETHNNSIDIMNLTSAIMQKEYPQRFTLEWVNTHDCISRLDTPISERFYSRICNTYTANGGFNNWIAGQNYGKNFDKHPTSWWTAAEEKHAPRMINLMKADLKKVTEFTAAQELREEYVMLVDRFDYNKAILARSRRLLEKKIQKTQMIADQVGPALVAEFKNFCNDMRQVEEAIAAERLLRSFMELDLIEEKKKILRKLLAEDGEEPPQDTSASDRALVRLTQASQVGPQDDDLDLDLMRGLKMGINPDATIVPDSRPSSRTPSARNY